MSTQLIETQRTANPERARESRISRRLAERVGIRLLARGGQRYADAVLESLGDPGKTWMVCSSCKRPYVQEWAVREMGRAMNRAIGNPEISMQIVNLIGASEEFARESVALRQQVQGMDDQARADYCLEAARKFYQGQGKRVVVLDDASNGGTDDTDRATP